MGPLASTRATSPVHWTLAKIRWAAVGDSKDETVQHIANVAVKLLRATEPSVIPDPSSLFDVGR